MKRFTKFIIIGILICICNSVYGQYRDIYCEKNTTTLQIEQIDFLENSTLLHIVCKANSNNGMSFNENAFLQIYGDNRHYRLLNSINMPISGEAEQKEIVFDRDNQEHKFTLEFEKVPDSLAFDMIESKTAANAFNIYGISVNRKKKSELVNIPAYIAPYPLKERGAYIINNNTIKYFRHNGLILSTWLSRSDEYGKYYQIQFDIKNLKGKSILFNPGTVRATSYMQKGKEKQLHYLYVLSSEEYSKKIRRKQAWNSFFYGLGEGLAAAGAGYSNSVTTYRGHSTTNSNVSAYGYGNTGWGYASAYGTSYTTAYGRVQTTTYNGAAAYAAQQIARQNAQTYNDQLYSIRERLEASYGKTNTLHNQVEYAGYLNIKYEKTDNLMITFNIDGETYNFTYIWE